MGYTPAIVRIGAPGLPKDWLSAAIAEYGQECANKLQDGVGQPEAAIRGPVEGLLIKVGLSAELEVVVHDEASMKGQGARPDFAVRVGGAITGHVELKKPKQNLDPTKFKGHNKKQWERLKDLPNLLYTNGTQWRLYRHGELQLQVDFDGDLHTSGSDLSSHDLATEALFLTFLKWAPPPITTVKQLVETVAPLCRLLRDSVLEQLAVEAKALKAGAHLYDLQFTQLAENWRDLLFPSATDEVFADGYAQTVTFAFLLARTEGINVAELHTWQIAHKLKAGNPHALMSQALMLLSQSAVASFEVTIDLLRRVIGAVQWEPIWEQREDAYIHLYESFLSVYDPDLRRQSGVYYTPIQVVRNMVRLTDDVLTTRLDAEQGYLSPSVTTIDPAMGTGAYLHGVIDHAAKRAEELDGPGAVGHAITDLAQRLIGFELKMGSYTVAEMRAVDILKSYGAELPKGGVRLHVTNTLDDPFIAESAAFPGLDALAKSHMQANKIKANTPVTVVIGNPPYHERAQGLGGWVEAGSDNTDTTAPLERFRKEGNGRVEYVLKNLYIYFWAWATWKVFDAQPQDRHGVVSFITTSGYLKGPGFKGMRRYLRETCSEGWIINVTPEGMQPDVPTRVFPGVQQPLAIAIFVRRADTDTSVPAAIHYTKVTGKREQKYDQLDALTLDGANWQTARTSWEAPFLPATESAWDDYPALGDLFCWVTPGITPGRTWIYGPHPSILQERWNALVSAEPQEKPKLLKETHGCTVKSNKEPLPNTPSHDKTINEESGVCPPPKRIAYRSFDRQWIIPDHRLIDRARKDLWSAEPVDGQVYITEQHSQAIMSGPAITFSTLIPDKHHFKGSEGGRVLPVLHPDGSLNTAPGLLAQLENIFGTSVTAHDLVAYIAGVAAHPAFTKQFAEELVTPGIRIPLTADPELWAEACEIGRQVVWTATYGEVFDDPANGRPKGKISFDPQDPRRPKNLAAIGSELPGKPIYVPGEEGRGEIKVGQGTFGPVTERMWNYDVGGMNVISKWFSYRKSEPGGKKTSPLDDIHLDTWPKEWITEFNELLTALRRITELENAQRELLNKVLSGPILTLETMKTKEVKFPESDKDRKPRYDLASTATQEGMF
ncbi:type ISP restriction/modification enzyme [Nocardiopsis sp. MG754419]|uniref:type ISP restriction/modification enzyme n=1 Tax=Nocardiopsis sp. MG754419 TaxID=2259865 RepID=UPI001BA47366|nr:type ISP restriction/modification enzyme [Nocardiopsis sp. MG754419]MBR8741463.1 DNA methyltransferase [Nocardiopsis sp. MG754419]